VCIVLLAGFGSGCASYFRGGKMSYQELEQKNQEIQNADRAAYQQAPGYYRPEDAEAGRRP